MKIIRHLEVPTGDILVVNGERGKLELLSLGDYGKEVNIKASFLGLDRELNKVQHTKIMPLEEKWVITISTQYGCSMGCPYCDVPQVGPGKNASFNDLVNQILKGIMLHPEVEFSKRLNVHFARMGEPSWNPNVLDCAKWLKDHIDPEYKCHPVVSTMMPKNNEWLKTFIHTWMRLKNRVYKGEAGLQISINSTNEKERDYLFNNNSLRLDQIAKIMDGVIVTGRKITLNFAIAEYEIDPNILLRYFNPESYIIKLTPMHKTKEAINNNIKTIGDYTTIQPYEKYENDLKNAGYDVLVFIASDYEDLSRITCGNAILSGSLPETTYKDILK